MYKLYIKNIRFGPEPKDRCIKWKIKTDIHVKACKRYAQGDSKHHKSQFRTSEIGRTKSFENLETRILNNSSSKEVSGRRKDGENHRGEAGGG